MNSTVTEPTKTLAALKSEMDVANVVLTKAVKKAIRAGKGPDTYKEEQALSRRAYRAYWIAYDASKGMTTTW